MLLLLGGIACYDLGRIDRAARLIDMVDDLRSDVLEMRRYEKNLQLFPGRQGDLAALRSFVELARERATSVGQGYNAAMGTEALVTSQPQAGGQLQTTTQITSQPLAAGLAAGQATDLTAGQAAGPDASAHLVPLAEMEKQHILHALELAGDNRTLAADMHLALGQVVQKHDIARHQRPDIGRAVDP